MERRDGKSINDPTPDPVQKMEMMQEIWARKADLESFEQIGKALGISASTAWKYFHEYELYLVPPSVEQDRLMAMNQLEKRIAEAAKMQRLCGNDVELWLKVSEHIRKLLGDYRRLQGLDAAKKHEHKVKQTTQMDSDIEGLLEQFGEFAEPEESLARKRRDERRGRFQR